MSKNLKQIIEFARKDNPDLPIYVVGIYNPLYLNFPDLTELQTLVDQWNQRTEETLSAYQGVYFVPINDLLYKGIDGKSGVTESELGKETVTNDALYDEDSFHPNNTGYVIMKEAVLEKIHATERKMVRVRRRLSQQPQDLILRRDEKKRRLTSGNGSF